MKTEKLIEQILSLKQMENCVLLAHNYQRPEIQDVADHVGDSLDLALQATETDAEYIVFCGVDFMAESAKILNPDKTVLIPDRDAKCPMAAMVEPEPLQALKKKHPRAEVVSYINTTAEIKALSDVCCTSSNGVKVVQQLDAEEIIFTPDINLGQYIQRFIDNKKLILWPGMCHTHHSILPKDIQSLKEKHPNAEILVHPECRPEVIDLADYAFSTNGMVNHVQSSPATEFIIGTEKGLCYRLKKENPTKQFYEIEKAVCTDMKKITLDKVYQSIKKKKPEIKLSQDIMKKAKAPLERMMNIGRGD